MTTLVLSFFFGKLVVCGKVAGAASEEVTLELLNVKCFNFQCLPVLFYGLESYPISN